MTETVKAEEDAPPKKIALVIDANVIIKQIRLQEMLGATDDQDFNERYEVHTLAAVLKEIKDENARTYLETRLPYTLITHDSLSDPAHLTRVVAFAKETGDYASLSATDLKVIALGI